MPESPPGLCLRSQDAKTITLQSLFSLIKLNLLSKNGHRLKCLDKSLERKIILIKKDFLEKKPVTMINMGGQRPKTGIN